MNSLHVAIDARLPDRGQGGVLSVVKSMAYAFNVFGQPGLRRTWVVLEQATWWRSALPPQDQVIQIAAPFGGLGLSLAAHVPSLTSKLAPLILALLGDKSEFDSLFRTQEVDLVHLPYQDGVLTDLPSVYFPHDLQHLHFPEYFSSSQIRHREQRWRNRALRATRVVAAASHIEADLTQKWGVDATKIDVFPFPPPYSDSLPHENLVTSRRPYVLYPAVFWPHKNHTNLVRAMAILKQRGAEIDLVLTGSRHSHFRKVMTLVKQLNVSECVNYLGHVDDAMLDALVRKSDAVVLPSLSEAFSLTAFDAIRCNRPLLCSDREFFRSQCGEFARYFNPLDPESIANEIQTQLTENQSRANLGSRAGARHPGLSHQSFAENLVRTYHRCLERSA